MRTNLFYLLTLIGLISPTMGRATSSVSTVPEGFFSFTFPAVANGSQAVATYLSLPLIQSPSYSGAVDTVTAASISVSDSPAPWTAGSLATAGTPYFVKFLSGAEAGRVMKITGNTSNGLTLDTTDNSLQTVSLTASSFAVQQGDTFEVFVGDTLSGIFGSQTSALVLNGGASPATADTVSVYNASALRWVSYYFDSSAGYWKDSLSSVNANNTVLYPYAGITVTRHAGDVASSLILTGRVSEVAALIKTSGSDINTFTSTHYAANITLAQLQFGTNWTKSSCAFLADTIAIWDAGMTKFDTYYQLPDSSWRRYGNPNTNQNNLIIAAGSVVSVLKRSAVSGASSFLQSSLPYSVN